MRYLLAVVTAATDTSAIAGYRQRRRALRWLLVALAAAVTALACWHVIQLSRLMGGRLPYPMDLEWMEGGQLYQAYRVMHGLPLWGDCRDGYLPFAYPPGHAIAVAVVGWLFGLDYPAARLVSIAAFTACVLTLCVQVRYLCRTPGTRLALPLVAAGALAATYPYAGDWYDIARVDSLYLGLLMLAAATALPVGAAGQVLRRFSWSRAMAVAALLGAAIYTKQTAALFAPWLCLFVWLRHRQSGVRLLVALAMVTGLPFAWLEMTTAGRFGVMVLGVMSRHPLVAAQALGQSLVLLIVAPYLPLVFVGSIWLWRRGRLPTRMAFWLGMLITALISSVITAAKVGAFTNNLASAMLLAPPVGLMVVARLWRPGRLRSVGRSLLAAVGLVAIAALLYQQLYDIRKHIPSRRRFIAARAFNAFIGSLHGGVIIPAHAFLAARNGHDTTQFHEQAYVDIMGGGVPSIDVVECLAGIDARWLIVNKPHNVLLQRLLDTAYVYHELVPRSARTSVGLYTRASYVFERRQADPLGLRRRHRRMLFDFETGGYAGWSRRGDAFEAAPATFSPGYEQPIFGLRGRRLANSFDPKRGDQVSGELFSPPFSIDRDFLGFRAGGGRSPQLQVVLEVGGRRVRRLRGPGSNLEVVVPFAWDVSAFRGERARLILVDHAHGPWGHLLVDAVELFDVTPAGAAGGGDGG